ncbi:MAG: thiamine pyrophosphate-dependent enzyme [Acidimicrobiia bacterium]|nr:thiamine pyrophosphate-dependent enzyme [Acidimicrobiia bacterium]
MRPDLERLVGSMARMRAFEEASAALWRRGLVSGSSTSGTGEEAIVAGVLDHLVEGDALALDHRSTPPLVARGVDLVTLLLELLGHEDGLCAGRGGHMHLLSREHLAASSGIVGAAGPTACGFAVAAEHLRPGRVAVAFFGEGAVNQGMLLESLNLAAAWSLPVVAICKDDRWAITTPSRRVTGGSLTRRARSFGLPARRVDGTDVVAVWRAAGRAVARARKGRGPSFLLARCPHLDGHFLGDPLLRVVNEPVGEARELSGPLGAATVASPGAPWRQRAAGLATLGATIGHAAADRRLRRRDPLARARRRLEPAAAARLEERARDEVALAVEAALARAGVPA